MVMTFIVTFIMFAAGMFAKTGFSIEYAQIIIAAIALLICCIQDYRSKTIAGAVIAVSCAVSAAVMIAAYGTDIFLKQLVAAAVALAALLATYYITKKGMGLGDVIVLTGMVFMLGASVSLLILGTASVVFIVYHFVTKKQEIAFVPFLFVGALPVLALV